MLFLGLIYIIMLYALPSIKSPLNNNQFLQITSIIIILTSFITINNLYIQSIGYEISLYSGILDISNFNLIITIIITAFALFILLILPSLNNNILDTINNYKDSILVNAKEYSILVLIFIFGSLLLIYSADFITFALCIELQSFSLYILTILYKNKNATINGLKYFILGSLSSAIIFLGIALIYSETGSFRFDSIFILLDVNSTLYQSILGFSLITLGILFKIGAAPLHFWSPDVYDHSKTSYTVWLNIMPKFSLLAVLIHFIVGINYNHFITTILLISSALSLIIGAVLGLSQKNIKRLFTYSTINHLGFMILALNSDILSINSLMFYLMQYTISTVTLFSVMLALIYTVKTDDNLNHSNSYSDVNKISSLTGLFFNNPILALSLTVTMFSYSGIPPLNGFFSKFYVLESAIYLGNYLIVFLAIIVSVISAAYYLKIVMLMFKTPLGLGTQGLTRDGIDTNKNNVININISNSTGLSTIHSNIIIIFTLVQLLYMTYPNLILNSIQLLSLSLFY